MARAGDRTLRRPVLGGTHRVAILRSTLPGPRSPSISSSCDPLFHRPGGLYAKNEHGADDGIWRFSLFVRAAIEAMKRMGDRPQVLHTHDWHPGLATMLGAWSSWRDPWFDDVASVLTIHNVGYQGIYGPEQLPVLGLPPETWTGGLVRGKLDCRAELCRLADFEPGDPAMIVGSVGRLAPQKGYDILLEAAPELIRRGVRIVVLGSGAGLEGRCAFSRRIFPGRFKGFIGYDDALSHKIQAGSDVLAVPSRYEPCGLTQMYALAYGTVPVVRRTGGLADSIIGLHGENLDWATGFTSTTSSPRPRRRDPARPERLSHRDAWSRLVRNGMKADFSGAARPMTTRARSPARGRCAGCLVRGRVWAPEGTPALSPRGISVPELKSLLAKKAEARSHDRGVEATLRIPLDVGESEFEPARRAVRPVARHRLDDVGHRKDARTE
ncbi:MAG: glycogen/starch synthase [Holophagales bacterium]|nr:glycogen/starch synthase [Holophagales bacterium]